MEEIKAKPAPERRANIIRQAEAIGINHDFISLLVDEFYSRIRLHPVLGPIFENAIEDRWDQHLAKLKLFWQSVALNAGVYSGNPVAEHAKLSTIEPQHFSLWLALFDETLKDTAPNEEARDYFMERANRIATSLQWSVFGPPLPEKKSHVA